MQMAAKAGRLADDMLLQRVAGAEANEGFAENLSEADAAQAGEARPVARGDHHQAIDEERFLLEMRQAGPGRGDAEIGSAAGRGLRDLVAGALVEIDVDPGVRDKEGGRMSRSSSAVAAVLAISRTRARRPVA
jgi:hypothetical protein